MRRAWVVVGLAACSFTPHPDHGTGDGGKPPDAHDANPGSDATPIDSAPPLDATPPAFMLDGMQFVINCKQSLDNANPPGCSVDPTSPTYENGVQLTGSAGDHWMVTLRIAGAMEPLRFANGTASSGGFYVGGDTGGDSGDNLYRIDVSSPDQHYFLNNGQPGQTYSTAFDYRVTIPIDGNAMVTFVANPQDSAQWQGVDTNDVPIALSGVTAPPPTASLYPQWAFVIVQSASL